MSRVNSTDVRFSLTTAPDLLVISENIAHRSSRGALVEEVKRLLRLALLAEKAGFSSALLERMIEEEVSPLAHLTALDSSKKPRPARGEAQVSSPVQDKPEKPPTPVVAPKPTAQTTITQARAPVVNPSNGQPEAIDLIPQTGGTGNFGGGDVMDAFLA